MDAGDAKIGANRQKGSNGLDFLDEFTRHLSNSPRESNCQADSSRLRTAGYLIPTGGLVDSYGFAGNWPEMSGTSQAVTGMERSSNSPVGINDLRLKVAQRVEYGFGSSFSQLVWKLGLGCC